MYIFESVQKLFALKFARCDSNCRLFSYCFIKRTELIKTYWKLVILHVLQTLWIFSSFAFPLSSPHYNTAYGWFAVPGLSYGLGLTKNEDRLSSFFVRKGGTWGYISLMQLYIFITVQILAYFTLNICTIFSPPTGGGPRRKGPL